MPIAIPLLVSLISGGIALTKTIIGAVQKNRGNKEVEKAIEGIKYSRPEEYEQIMGKLNQRESSINTRREAVEDRVRSTTASSIPGISQLADNPVAGLTAYSGLKQREQQAIADIGIDFEEKRDQAVMGQVQGLGMGADYSDKESYYNDMYKKMVQANMGANKMSAGTNMMWGGMEGAAAAGIDYLGTKYLGDIYSGGQKDYNTTGETQPDIYDPVMGKTGD